MLPLRRRGVGADVAAWHLPTSPPATHPRASLECANAPVLAQHLDRVPRDCGIQKIAGPALPRDVFSVVVALIPSLDRPVNTFVKPQQLLIDFYDYRPLAAWIGNRFPVAARSF